MAEADGCGGEAYTVPVEETRCEDAQQDGKPEKNRQKSKRLWRFSTAEKRAEATLEEDVWPAEDSVRECTWRYSRVARRIIDGQAVLVAYHIYAGQTGDRFADETKPTA